MTQSIAETDDVFILRFWRETKCDALDMTHWRVRITEVRTERHTHADGVEAAFDIVRSSLLKGKSSRQRVRSAHARRKEAGK